MSRGLQLENVSIWQEQRLILQIDATVKPGEVLTIMGPSGTGKSTLLSFIIGTIGPDFRTEGRVWMDGVDITRLPTNRRRIGILFQDDLLFPHLSVGGNLGFGLAPGGTSQDRRRKIDMALNEVGLGGFGDRDPATLSGGQKARVSLMRMLLSAPGALLLDEPFSRLDAELRDRTRTMVFELAKTRGLPVILVTHDRDDADAAGGDIIELS